MYNTSGLLLAEDESITKSHHRIPKLDDSDIIILNIGGQRFETTKGTLRNHPNSKLARLNKRSEEYDFIKGEFFFDRNPVLFEWILDYYRYGLMHIPLDVCVNKISEELDYWELASETIAGCCRQKYREMMHEYATYLALKKEFEHGLHEEKHESVGISALQKLREKIWIFLDDIGSSKPAKVFGVIYYLLIILSVATVFLGTMKEFRVPRTTDIPYNKTAAVNGTIDQNSKLYRLRTTQPHWVLGNLDHGLMFFFTLDFILRLLVTPSITKMFTGIYICDIIYLIPVWCRFIIDMFYSSVWLNDSGVQWLLIIDILMVFRALRMFMLARYYRGLRVLLLALKACLGELVLLMLFVSFSLTIYACCIYSAEVYNDLAFDNVFIGLYWGLITMTTVGYGDIVPKTTAGYIVSVMCAMTGVIIIGMVVPIFAGNFTLYYRYRDAGIGHLEKKCSKHVLPKEMVRPSRNGGDIHEKNLFRVENCKDENNVDDKVTDYTSCNHENEDSSNDVVIKIKSESYFNAPFLQIDGKEYTRYGNIIVIIEKPTDDIGTEIKTEGYANGISSSGPEVTRIH
ncbi:hypothetical protein CHS0354_041464 [Potamilus streckersoni]|uniref:BTB domain-containing protein n=1 Tax=Potamilus streckersoni TaxID=2493646 RepID=A0AAE0W9L4_9BIVA|nr:hypothetical protein CHS0354_041464 [Potamilus streckersoni]